MTESQKTFPAEIAKAVVAVMRNVKKLGKDGRNEHGRYNFTSVDAFYEAVGPLCADAGLFVLVSEIEREVSAAPSGRDNERASRSLRVVYDISLIHESGAVYSGIEREVTVVASGPQSYASAQSFVTKYFLRNLFQVPTGDKDDADLQEATPLPAGRSVGRKAAAKVDEARQKGIDAFVSELESLLASEPDSDTLAVWCESNSAKLKWLAANSQAPVLKALAERRGYSGADSVVRGG